MKLKEYLQNLNKFVIKYPKALDYDVVYAKDDEGNGFREVNYGPYLGYLGAEGDDWVGSEECHECEVEINSVCIN